MPSWTVWPTTSRLAPSAVSAEPTSSHASPAGAATPSSRVHTGERPPTADGSSSGGGRGSSPLSQRAAAVLAAAARIGVATSGVRPAWTKQVSPTTQTTGQPASSRARAPPGRKARERGSPKAVAPASETKDVTPHALSTSWLPRSVTTRPPAAAACILRLRSSARHSASCGPRSSTSPHCTSTASPPVHLAVASTKPAVRSTLTKASQSPWRSPTATVRDGAGRRILSTALGSAAGLRVERSSAGRAAEKARRGTSMCAEFAARARVAPPLGLLWLLWCAGDSTSTRQFAPVSSLCAVRESCFV
mmetsp:Transcript_22415/g.73161  ORF Transcript_22415/g.73161 Transcript_22415/m.73161 type:complete len:305 (+) Transcript_22415:1089-2003(+)